MQGVHDLGGKQGLGPINPESEAEEPVFHSEWERRIFGLTLATGMLGKWNIDQSRYARERQHPISYLENSYYENWYEGVSKLLVEKGLISEAELLSGISQQTVSREFHVPTREDVKKILSSGGPTEMRLDVGPVFCVGDHVRVIRNFTHGHSRVPAYVQGCVGKIEIHHGGHIFPDKSVEGLVSGEHLYAVRFSGKELWRSDIRNDEVIIDLWEPYLRSSN